jgi:hypothetical protein
MASALDGLLVSDAFVVVVEVDGDDVWVLITDL